MGSRGFGLGFVFFEFEKNKPQTETICPYAEPVVIPSFCCRHALKQWTRSRSSYL